MVNGRALNLLPGQYADVEDFDARRLVTEGAAYFADEKGAYDTKIDSKYSAGKPSGDVSDGKNLSKSGRVKRRRRNNRDDKRGDSKT